MKYLFLKNIYMFNKKNLKYLFLQFILLILILFLNINSIKYASNEVIYVFLGLESFADSTTIENVYKIFSIVVIIYTILNIYFFDLNNNLQNIALRTKKYGIYNLLFIYFIIFLLRFLVVLLLYFSYLLISGFVPVSFFNLLFYDVFYYLIVCSFFFLIILFYTMGRRYNIVGLVLFFLIIFSMYLKIYLIKNYILILIFILFFIISLIVSKNIIFYNAINEKFKK